MVESKLKEVLKRIRSLSTGWLAKPTLSHLEAIRRHELELVLGLMPPSGRVLEIGAGTGWQAQVLEDHGYDVSAIDLALSNYRENRIRPIIDYDGSNIPFRDQTFDVIFSSNVLEHIPHVYEFQREIHRVLRPSGRVIHVVPSSSWRFWTNITHLLRSWTIPRTHGEHAKNALVEMFYFSRRWWTKLFCETGWEIDARHPNRLFYTGHSIMDSRLSTQVRIVVSYILGSACNIYILREKPLD